MSINLVVFRPKEGELAASEEWLKEFNVYLRRKKNLAITVAYRDVEKFSDAPYLGSPFILVERLDEVIRRLRRLSDEAAEMLSNNAYYWILSGGGDGDLEDHLQDYSRERPVMLDWQHKNFEAITSRLEVLDKYPRLAGLSRQMHKVRTDITRIAAGRKGPWSSVLILGQSGTGKEEVALSIYESHDFTIYTKGENKKRSGNFTELSCGTFSKELLPSQLFGIGPRVATGVDPRDGLLKLGSNGCVFLDDFDTALDLIQGPLLRVMATSEAKPATFYRVGEENLPGRVQKTWVWLMFSTNADIISMTRQGELREDFIFRFRDRIIHIPPLGKRPADIPAIAIRIWDGLWEGEEERKRPLTAPVLRHLLLREKDWKGNVRALQTVLSLMASMASLPAHTFLALSQIIDAIMPPGSDFYDWVGMVLKDSFIDATALSSAGVQDILKLDSGDNCMGPGQNKATQTGSEREAQARLSPLGQQKFGQLLSVLAKKREKVNLVRPRVRLARIIAYVARFNRIDRHTVVDLCQVKDAQASLDLKMLQDAGILQPEKDSATRIASDPDVARRGSQQATGQAPGRKKSSADLLVFVKVAAMFRP